jgi:hypothetical protein
MDSPFGLPVPDPFQVIEDSIQQPPLEPTLSPDPLDGILDKLEASIEQTTLPELDLCADPLGHMLHTIEAATESQSQASPFFTPEPLHGILDKLEADIEQQLLKEELLPSSPHAQNNLHAEANTTASGIKSGSLSEPPALDKEQICSARYYPLPLHRMHGSRTGIRNNGDGPECYCYLHESWIQPEDCRSCADFEPAESDSSESEDCCHSSQYMNNA